jgi:hypothetical protein
MSEAVKLALLSAALLVLLILGAYGVSLFRKWAYRELDEEEYDQQSDALYTTAELERMKSEGLVDEKEYERLKKEVAKASMRRAKASKHGKP